MSNIILPIEKLIYNIKIIDINNFNIDTITFSNKWYDCDNNLWYYKDYYNYNITSYNSDDTDDYEYIIKNPYTITNMNFKNNINIIILIEYRIIKLKKEINNISSLLSFIKTNIIYNLNYTLKYNLNDSDFKLIVLYINNILKKNINITNENIISYYIIARIIENIIHYLNYLYIAIEILNIDYNYIHKIFMYNNIIYDKIIIEHNKYTINDYNIYNKNKNITSYILYLNTNNNKWNIIINTDNYITDINNIIKNIQNN